MEFDIALAGRLLLAVLLGGMIGYERQQKHKAAGLRTHILVCLASAALMGAAERYYGNGHVEIARIAAAIITGIGFLGAGTIISHGTRVRGLTTAASVWYVSGIGIIVGMGEYALAAAATVLGFILLLNKHIDRLAE